MTIDPRAEHDLDRTAQLRPDASMTDHDQIGDTPLEHGAARYRKLLVIGATGPTGKEIVAQARARGYRVAAFAHATEDDDAAQTADVTHIVGDVLDAPAVARAMDGVDAVLSALGSKPSLFHEVTMLSQGTQNIVAAMQTGGVKRLIAITGIGAGDSKGHGGFVYDKIVGPAMLGQVYKDKDRQEDVIRASDLDWTIVRPAQLTDGPARHAYQVLTDLTDVTAHKIARADVAAFMLDELERGTYIRQTPLITDSA